jgi:hypothetical protein
LTWRQGERQYQLALLVYNTGKIMKRGGRLLGVDLNRVRKLAYESRDYVVEKSGFTLPTI